jgi:hypothetical protein
LPHPLSQLNVKISGALQVFYIVVRHAFICLFTFTRLWAKDLLKDETAEVDLVGPTLPSLKALLEISVLPTAEGKEKFTRTVHGLVSSCLLSIDGLR